MTAARCTHGQPVAVDGTGCAECGPVAQLANARTARDRGMKAALDRPAAGQDLAVVIQAIRHVAASGEPFTVDDVRPLLPVVGVQVIGSAFRVAAGRGLIERVGDTQSTHTEGHARRISVWRGTGVPRPHDAPEVRKPRTDPPAQQAIADKAARLLAAGRVRVRLVDEQGRAVADVEGDGGVYEVRRTAGGRWSCPCAAGRHGRRCGHVAAVRLVVAE